MAARKKADRAADTESHPTQVPVLVYGLHEESVLMPRSKRKPMHMQKQRGKRPKTTTQRSRPDPFKSLGWSRTMYEAPLLDVSKIGGLNSIL
jgi:hypothetical protein